MLDNLRGLNLNRTNVTAATINKLYGDRPDAARRLIRLNLVDTAVDLTQFSDSPALANMTGLTDLFLPRPVAGDEAEFRLPAMPELERISIQSMDRGKNASVASITINDCPRLKELRLGLMQKYSLNLSNLPSLESILKFQFKTTLRLGSKQRTPGSLWVKSIVVDDAPKLKEIRIYAAEVEHYRFTNTPGFEFLGPGVYQVRPSGYSSTSEYDDQVAVEATAALVDGLSQSDGPTWSTMHRSLSAERISVR